MRHVVGRAADLAPGGRLIVVVEGRSIGVFNVGGELFAVRDACPHQGGPLCLGTLSGLLTASAPGEYTYDRRSEVLRCPWHGWEFDIRTGHSLVDPVRWRVRTYPVSVAGDQLVLEM